MSARTLSEVNRAQEAQIETLLGMVRELTAMQAATLAALTEARKPTAAESVTIKRVGTGEKVTAAEVVAVVQEGETAEQTAARAAEIYERLAARYPLPNGQAHLAELGDGLDDWRATLDGSGLHAVPDPEPTK